MWHGSHFLSGRGYVWTAHYGRCAGIIAVLVNIHINDINVGLQQPLLLVARLAAATSVAVFRVVFC